MSSAEPEERPQAAETEDQELDLSTARPTPRQLEMIRHPARTLWIGAGTKTGKTIAFVTWIAEGILAGEPTAWSGSVGGKTKKVYKQLKEILKEASDNGEIQFNDTTSQIIPGTRQGLFDPYTGENPEPIFGSGYKRFVIDEASRQTERTYIAAMTTISALRGQLRVAFNLDHGARNWAIRNLLRVKGLPADQRASQGEDLMMFPTIGEGFVPPEDIEKFRLALPKVMFDALFLAIIPEQDVSVFRNLPKIWGSGGPAPKGPEREHTYIMGVDLARKQNWTVATVLDVTSSRFVAAVRFHQIDWTLQYERLAQFARYWRVVRSWVDQTGLGDPVVEQLERRAMPIEGVMFRPETRKDLIEGLIVGCDGMAFSVADDPELQVHKVELEQFELKIGKDGRITYAVPEHQNDDAAFSMMLAWYGKQRGNFGAPRIVGTRDRAEVEAHDYSAL